MEKTVRERFVEILNDRIPLKDLRVFEPGCGDGVFTEQLALVAKTVMAVDGRAENLRKASAKTHHLLNVQLDQGDVESTNFQREYDVVFHVGLLYHLADPVAHLKQMFRIARRAVFLDTHHAPRGASTSRHENVKMPREGMRPISVWLPLNEIIAIAGECGFLVEIVNQREERNGPRATLLCTRK